MHPDAQTCFTVPIFHLALALKEYSTTYNYDSNEWLIAVALSHIAMLALFLKTQHKGGSRTRGVLC